MKKKKETKEETVKRLRDELRKLCPHINTFVVREGQTGTLGTVHCRDCGFERDWNAY